MYQCIALYCKCVDIHALPHYGWYPHREQATYNCIRIDKDYTEVLVRTESVKAGIGTEPVTHCYNANVPMTKLLSQQQTHLWRTSIQTQQWQNFCHGPIYKSTRQSISQSIKILPITISISSFCLTYLNNFSEALNAQTGDCLTSESPKFDRPVGQKRRSRSIDHLLPINCSVCFSCLLMNKCSFRWNQYSIFSNALWTSVGVLTYLSCSDVHIGNISNNFRSE